MPRIAVLTSITNGVDDLHLQQNYDGADFFCFTDNLEQPSGKWILKPAYWRFKCPNRNGKIHRCLPHLFLPNYDYWIWMDGTHVLKESPAELVEKYMDGFYVTFMKHEKYDCIFDEIQVTKECQKYKNEISILEEQEKFYREKQMPEHFGLWNTSIYIRQNTTLMQQFGNHVWAHVCRFCKNEQIAAPFVAWDLNISWNLFPSNYKNNGFSVYIPHKKTDEQQALEIAREEF